MAKVEQDLFALIDPHTEHGSYRLLLRRAGFVRECLFDKYVDAHQHEKEEEREKYKDGFIWKGPTRFVAPIDSICECAPNVWVLESIESALCGIHDWPNARKQAFQLKRCVEVAGEKGQCKEIAQIGDLVAKIAREKPYGDQTVGFNLLDIDWAEFPYWNISGDGVAEDPLALIIEDLSGFAQGKYTCCLQDYPYEPFYHLKRVEFYSPEEGAAIINFVVKENYPTLLERPDLLRNLGIFPDVLTER